MVDPRIGAIVVGVTAVLVIGILVVYVIKANLKRSRAISVRPVTKVHYSKGQTSGHVSIIHLSDGHGGNPNSYLPTPSSMWLGSQCDYRGPRCPSPVSVCSNPGTIPLCPWDKFPFTETHPEWLILLIYACHLPWIYHMHLIVKNWLSYQRNWILRLMNYCFTVVICTNITSVSLLTRVQSFELSVV